MSVARRRERYLSQYLSDTTNERANEQTKERERTRKSVQAHRGKKEEKEQASEKKQACMQATNRMENREIAKEFDSLYAHVLVQLYRHHRYIDEVLETHNSQNTFLSNLFAYLFPVFFYSFFIISTRDLDSLVVIFYLFTIIFYVLIQ
jgi:hypothetical protein